MAITYRLAVLADLDLLTVLMREYYAFDQLNFDERVARQALEQLLSDARLGRVWLIQDQEEVIGYLVLTFGFSLEFHGRDAVLDELYLRAGYRRRGIGTQTMQWLEAVCRSLGLHALHLVVERANTQAQAVYRKAGFEDHDRYLMTRWLRNPP